MFIYWLLLVAVFCVETAYAQEQGNIYLTAGIGLPTQQAQGGSHTFPTAPVGTTVGGAIGAGVFVSSLVSLETDLSRTRLIENQQDVRDFIVSERRRDSAITTLLRFHPQRGRRVQMEPVAGFAITIPQSSYQTTGADGHVQPKADRLMPVLIGLAMGIDARVGTERFSVVPSLRFRVTSGNPDEFIPRGYPRWTVTPSVAARVGFHTQRRDSRRTQKPTYLTGAAGFSVHPKYVGSTQPPELQSPDGRTQAIMGGGGVFLSRNIALDIGFFRLGSIGARQRVRYGRIVNHELRKNFITAGARFRLPVTRRLQVEPVTAFLLTIHEGVQQEECCYLFPGQTVTVSQRFRTAFPISPGFAAGVDVPIGNERVAFVPSFRVFFTHQNFNNYNSKYVRLTWAPNFGVRLGF